MLPDMSLLCLYNLPVRVAVVHVRWTDLCRTAKDVMNHVTGPEMVKVIRVEAGEKYRNLFTYTVLNINMQDRIISWSFTIQPHEYANTQTNAQAWILT